MRTVHHRSIVLCCAVIIATLSSSALAASWTWNGSSGNDHWTNTPNWTPASNVDNDGTADVIFAGTTRLTPDMNLNWNINSLTFDSTAGSFELASSTNSVLTLGAGGLTDNSANAQAIDHGITLGTAQTWNIAAGSLAIYNSINLGGSALTVTGTAGANASFYGVLSGAAGLTKTGATRLLLGGYDVNNTYSGGTTVNAGTLVLEKLNNLQAIRGLLSIGDPSGTGSAMVSFTYSNEYNSNGAATFLYAGGLLELNGNNNTINDLDFTGGTVDTAGGTLTQAAGASLNTFSSSTTALVFGSLSLSGGQFFNTAVGTTASGIDLDVNGKVINGTIVKIGNGTVRFSGTNTAFLTVDAGMVLIGSNSPGGTGPLNLFGGTIAADGSARSLSNPVTLANAPIIAGSMNLTLSGIISGSGSLNKSGISTLTLSAANTYTGGTVVNGGVISVAYTGNDGKSAVGHSNLTINNAATVLVSTTNALGFFASAPAITINAGGLLTSSSGATQHLNNLTLSGGTLASPAPPNGSLAAFYGTYNLDNNVTAGGSTTTSVISATFFALTSTGGTTFTVSPGADSGIDLDVTGTIGNPPGVTNTALIKAGTGLMQLSNANSFTAPINVNAGTLTLAAGASVASNSITVASGATLNVSGTLPSTATVNNSGTTNFAGNPATDSSLTRSLATLSIDDQGVATIGLSASAGFPEILTTTTLSFTGSGKLDLGNNELTTTAAVEVIRDDLVNGALFTSHTGAGTALGYADIGGGVTEVRYTLLGDTNLDGTVDVGDLGAMATNYGLTTDAIWSQGDFNYDATVDVGDLGALATNYGTSLAADSATSDITPPSLISTGATVPEPASAALLALATCGLLAQRRRVQRNGVRRHAATLTITAAAVAGLAGPVRGATTNNWTDGTGDWSKAANWTNPGGFHFVPADGDTVNIARTDGVNRTITYDYTGSAVTLALLTVDLTNYIGTNTSTLSMPAGNLTAATEYIGYSGGGSNGTGTFTQSGGTNAINANGNGFYLAVNATDKGFYNLSDSGVMTSNNIECVGYLGTGTFTQSGGANTINAGFNDLKIGLFGNSSGTYNLSGGAFTLSGNGRGEYIGVSGVGFFSQTGGSNTLNPTNNLYLGYNSSGHGAYGLSSGFLSVGGTEYVGYAGTGFFAQSGGTHTISGNLYIGATQNTGVGTLDVYGGSVSTTNVYIGGDGPNDGAGGTLDIFGSGAVTAANQVVVLPGSALYLENGGTLTAGDFTFNPNTFHWTGGTLNALSGLILDDDFNFGDSLHLSGSQTLNCSENLYLGYVVDTGTVTQDGPSSVTVGVATSRNLYLGLSVVTNDPHRSRGVYTLSNAAASLLVNGNAYIGGDETQADGSGLFTVSAGTATITGTLKLWNNGSVNLSGAGATLNVGALDNTVSPLNFHWSAGTLNFLQSLTVNSATLFGSTGASYTLSSGKTLGCSATLTNDIGLTVSTGATLTTMSLMNNATISGSGAVIVGGDGGSFINSGDFSNTGSFQSTGPVTNAGTFTLSGTQTWSDGTTFTNTAGSATFQSDAGSTGASPLTISASNGVVTFSSDQHLAALNLSSTGQAVMSAAASTLVPNILNVTTLSLSGNGTLDLVNNEMLTVATPAVIQTDLVNGSIFTSRTGTGTALGYADVGGGVTEVRYTLLGDTNLDGTVDVGDLGALATDYGLAANAIWSQGDFNYDGKVDVGDLGALATNYGASLAAGSINVASAAAIKAGNEGTASVPEPTAGLLGLSIMSLFPRRRRRWHLSKYRRRSQSRFDREHREHEG